MGSRTTIARGNRRICSRRCRTSGRRTGYIIDTMVIFGGFVESPEPVICTVYRVLPLAGEGIIPVYTDFVFHQQIPPGFIPPPSRQRNGCGQPYYRCNLHPAPFPVPFPGPWPLAPGPWSLVPGPRSLAPGPWSLVPGPWLQKRDAEASRCQNHISIAAQPHRQPTFNIAGRHPVPYSAASVVASVSVDSSTSVGCSAGAVSVLVTESAFRESA